METCPLCGAKKKTQEEVAKTIVGTLRVMGADLNVEDEKSLSRLVALTMREVGCLEEGE